MTLSIRERIASSSFPKVFTLTLTFTRHQMECVHILCWISWYIVLFWSDCTHLAIFVARVENILWLKCRIYMDLSCLRYLIIYIQMLSGNRHAESITMVSKLPEVAHLLQDAGPNDVGDAWTLYFTSRSAMIPPDYPRKRYIMLMSTFWGYVAHKYLHDKAYI